MKRAASRRAKGRPWTRSGLPVICGVKLPDGRRCQATVGPCGRCKRHADPSQCPKMPADLTPTSFEHWYLTWLKEQGRKPAIPKDTEAFLGWWSRYPATDLGDVPFSMDLHQLRDWWLIWCRGTGGERLIPFDLARFREHWLVT
jgi:hypothetical protein